METKKEKTRIMLGDYIDENGYQQETVINTNTEITIDSLNRNILRKIILSLVDEIPKEDSEIIIRANDRILNFNVISDIMNKFNQTNVFSYNEVEIPNKQGNMIIELEGSYDG
jgi:hypothetical protein